MEPKIIDKEQIILVGMSYFGDPFKEAEGWSSDNEIGKLWRRYMNFHQINKDLEYRKHLKTPNAAMEVHIGSGITSEKNEFNIFVGAEVDKLESIPPQLEIKILPKSTYAVFTLKGDEITSNWVDYIWKEWLPNSRYKESYDFLIQYYDERFKGMDNKDSELDILVPIRQILPSKDGSL